ncbi:MAG: DNA translocase FtsK 4TM domain-containing protein, partial [Methylophilaceae bacterium]
MFIKKKTNKLNTRPEKIVSEQEAHKASLLKEAWWLVLVLLGLFLSVILMTYHPDDPSWSHQAAIDAITQNKGGSVGAWLSDMLLNLFGFSAWW